MHQLRHRDPIGKHARQQALTIEAALGEETFAQTVKASVGVHTAVPVLYPGTRSFLHNGDLFPQIEGGGFSSLSDLISEMTGGKQQNLVFNKAGAAGVVGTAAHLWLVGSWPVAGATGGTTGSGVARTSASQGAFSYTNPTGGDTMHVIGGTFQGSIGTQTLVLYDRLWDMTHTMTVDPRSTDGTAPSRYQDSTAAGTVLTGEVTTVLPGSSPTVTFDYIDQGGANTTSPSNTIRSGAAVNSSPFPLGQWFAQIDSADTGIRAFQNSANGINLSAAMASGVVTWILARPLAFIPIPTANVPVLLDGINSAMNLVKIVDSAALAFLEIKGATNATNWFGNLTICSG
jgi:hypothetical protein